MIQNCYSRSHHPITAPGGRDTWGSSYLQRSPGLRAAAGQEVRCSGGSWSGGSWSMWYDVMRRQVHPQVIQVMLEHDLVLKPVVTSGTSIFFFETSKWLTTTRTKWLIKPVGGWSWIHVYRNELISTTGISVLSGIFLLDFPGMDMDGWTYSIWVCLKIGYIPNEIAI